MSSRTSGILITRAEYDSLRSELDQSRRDTIEARSDAKVLWQTLARIMFVAPRQEYYSLPLLLQHAAHVMVRLHSTYLRDVDVGVLDQVRRDYGFPAGYVGASK